MTNHTNVTSGDPYYAVRRASWGAIFAGTVVAMVVQISLSLLGLSIGLGVVNPNAGANAMSDLGIGADIWLCISALISLFIGGFIAARLAGMPNKPDGGLHGIVVWGLGTLFSIYLATSAVGTAVSGVAGILGQGAQLAGQGVSAVAPQAAKAVKANPNKARQAAQQAVEEAKQQYGQVRQQAAKTLAGAKQQAAQTARQVAPVASGAALGAFIALLLGAFAAVFGGMAGIPKDVVASTATRR